MGRKLCIIGFCRSIEMLSDVVEDTVLEHGGEVCTLDQNYLFFNQYYIAFYIQEDIKLKILV